MYLSKEIEATTMAQWLQRLILRIKKLRVSD